MIDNDRLVALPDFLSQQIRGQSFAMKTLSKAVQRAELGFSKTRRPKSVFLFLGPTGVGKTESMNLLGEFLYGSRDVLVRFDMGEYGHEDALQRLVGESRSDPGLLPQAIDANPNGGILLLDEIEKAHPKIAKVFLAVTDAARVTGADGKERDLQKWYITFTSNLGSKDAIKMSNVPYSTLERTVIAAATNFFAPETMARFQHKIVFNSLSYDIQREICQGLVEKEVLHLAKTLHDRYTLNIPITYDRDVLTFLVRKGYTREMGARAMRDTVENHFGDPISQLVLTTTKFPFNSAVHLSAPPKCAALTASIVPLGQAA